MEDKTDRHRRIASIDVYRGFAVLWMVITHFLSRVEWTPWFLKNTPDVGFSPPDLIAPMFIFAIGLTMPISFMRRKESDGAGRTMLHFLRRSFALIGIGFLTPWGYDWGLFQTLGAAILLASIFMFLPSWARAMSGIALLIGYQYALEHFWLEEVLHSVWGGIHASLAWGALLILSTCMANLIVRHRRRQRILYAIALLVLVTGIALTRWFPISMHRVTVSYALIGLGASALIALFFDDLVEKSEFSFKNLRAWGANPLLLYVLHYYLWVYVFLFPPSQSWHREAPIWIVGLQGVLFLAVLTLIARIFHRLKWYLSM